MKYRITIPEPCHEDWDKMTPTEKGRFCAACKRNLVDFTTYSTQDLFREISASNGNVCGRFRNDQLNKLIYAEPYKKPGFISYAFASALAFFNAPSATAKHKTNTAIVGIENPLASKYSVTSNETDTLTIRGIVVDTTGKSIGEGVQISIQELPYDTFTGTNGEFSLIIRSKVESDSLTFLVNPFSDYSGELRVAITELYERKPLQITVNKSCAIGRGTTGIPSVEEVSTYTTKQLFPTPEPLKPSFWQRIGNWFRRFF